MADNSGLIVSALQQTNPSLYAAIDAPNSWKAALIKRGARVALYRKYERGDHRADITTEMRKMLRLNEDEAGMKDFNANYCRVIVDKMAGRIYVSDISVDKKSAEAWLKETLLRNDFDAQQSELYRGAIRDGDAYVMVDTETGLWTNEPAYDNFSGIVVIFDDMTRKPVWACKLWSESDTQDVSSEETTKSQVVMRVIVYQPSFITYWTGAEGGQEVVPDKRFWAQYEQPSEDSGNSDAPVAVDNGEFVNYKVWPLESGSLPIVHLANQKDNYTSYGESELRPAVPLQDVLNRTLHSMVMASEFSAFKLMWSIGFEIDINDIVPGSVINMILKDADGNVIVNMTQDQAEFVKAAKVGQFEATDLSQYTNQIDKIVQQISQSTQTPIYGVTATGNLSGEALKQLEIGLIGKIERFQKQNTDAIKELIILTAEIQNTFEGQENAPAFEEVSVTWKTPELLDANARIAILTTMRSSSSGLFSDSLYRSRIGSLLGMSQDDIAADEKKLKKEQKEKAKNMDPFALPEDESDVDAEDDGNEEGNPSDANSRPA